MAVPFGADARAASRKSSSATMLMLSRFISETICESGGESNDATFSAFRRRLARLDRAVDGDADVLQRGAKCAGGEERRIVDDERVAQRPAGRTDRAAHVDAAVRRAPRDDASTAPADESNGASHGDGGRRRLERHRRGLAVRAAPTTQTRFSLSESADTRAAYAAPRYVVFQPSGTFWSSNALAS